MPSTDRFTAPSAWGRYALISGGVALLHGAALWALQTGLVPTAAPTIVPAEVIAEFIAPPTPEVAPPPPAPPAPAAPVRQMSAAANGATYEQYIAAGWNDAQLVAGGLMLP